MKVKDRIYLVGSGQIGLNQTDDYDCNVFLIDGGDSLMLIDSDAGIKSNLIINGIKKAVFAPIQIDYLLLMVMRITLVVHITFKRL